MSEQHEPFYIRAINRMRDTGLISNEAHARMVVSGISSDPYMALGTWQALLAVTLWPSTDNHTTTPRRKRGESK